MKVLLFDTETNGLPKRFNAPFIDTDNWPAIISIAWQVWEISSESQVKISEDEKIIQPGRFVWDTESEKIHGITKEHATEHGVPGSTFFPEFKELVATMDVVVAHNLQFDKNVLLAELVRRNPTMIVNWWPRLEYCTCANTTDLCKLPSPTRPGQFKMPKLVELYEFLYEKKGEFAFHTAGGDVECLTQCFLELVRRKVVRLDLWERSFRV